MIMKLYYEHKGITIYHADCREILPQLPEVDLVLTDPPYEIEAHTSMRRTRASFVDNKKKALDFAPITEDLRKTICAINCNWLLIFCQAEAVFIYQQMLGVKYKRPMVWIKPDAAPQFTGDRPAMGYESIVAAWCSSGKSRWNAGGKRGVYTHNCTHGRESKHPTEKPKKLIRELMRDFNLGGIVLDPCMGSGTTLVNAKEFNLNAIGIEIEEKYCEMAVKRLAQEVLL